MIRVIRRSNVRAFIEQLLKAEVLGIRVILKHNVETTGPTPLGR